MLAFEAGLAQLPRSLIAAIWDAFDTFRPMWKPSEEYDKEIRRWMKSKAGKSPARTTTLSETQNPGPAIYSETDACSPK
jgi:hypothetical protein